jgi:hypothetical protein
MSDKIRVYDVFDTMHPSDGIDSVIATIQRAKAAEASGEWDGIELEDDYDAYDTGYNSSKWLIRGYRWENDKEYAKRMKDLEKVAELAKKAKEKEKVDERKLYEKLKKKYGDK